MHLPCARRCFRLLLAVLLAAGPAAAMADSLLAAWRAAQSRDPATMAARRSVQLAGQRNQLEVARERLRLVEQDLALRAARTYFDTLVARQDADLALEQLGTMALQLRSAQRDAVSGAATAAEVEQALARFEQAREQRVAASRELDRRRAELERLTGGIGTTDGLGLQAPGWTAETSDPGYWAALASAAHPRVRLQQAALDAAIGELDQRETGAPSVDVTANRARIFGDTGHASPAEMVIRSRSAQLGLVLTVPLADADPESRLTEALARRERSEAGLAAARGEAAQQAVQALSGLTQALSRVQLLAPAVQAGRSVFEALQAGLRAGTRLRDDALQRVQQFYAGEREWNKARVETLLQGLQLEAAAGGLDERDMRRVNAMLVAMPDAPRQLP